MSLLLFFLFQGISAQKFTIPVFPDTQQAVCGNPDLFYLQNRWLAEKKDSLNIPIVLHVGDLVNFDNYNHWKVASAGMKILDDAQVPYAITLGNHDTEAVGENSGSAAPGNVNENLRKTYKFNEYFPVSRFTLQQGRYEPGKSDNAYYTFEAGGVKWIVITLEFCARQGAAQWMGQVLTQFADHNAIILTHFHLNTDGTINTTNAGYGDWRVIDIYNHYIRFHKNVLMILSGHVCESAKRTDVGIEGNTIYQMLQNYQCYPDYGGGYIRLLDIDVEAKTIDAKIYSPLYNKTLEGTSTFSFKDVNFIPKSETGVNNALKDNIEVYPNPVSDIINIESKNNENLSIEVWNLQGILLKKTTETNINLSSYPAGVYFLSVNGKQTKLMKN